MDYYLNRIRKENEYVVECLNGKVNQLEQEILEIEGEKFERDQLIIELTVKFNKSEATVMEKNQILGKYEEKMRKLEVESQAWQNQKVEKDKVILQLNENIKKLRNDVLDKNRDVKSYEEKVGLLEREIQQLKGGKSKADHAIAEMKCKLQVADKTVHELKCEKAKKSQERREIINKSNATGKLENQISVRNQVAGIYKEKMEPSRISGIYKEKLEPSKISGIYKEKLEPSKSDVRKLERENQELKNQIPSADQTIEKVVSRPLDADLTIDKIKYQPPKGHWKKKIAKYWYEETGTPEYKSLENDQAIIISDVKVEEPERDIKGLKDEKLSVDETIDKMKGKRLAADQIIVGMKQGRSKANHAVQELKGNPAKIVSEYRSQVSAPTIKAGSRDLSMPMMISTCTPKRPRSALQKKGIKVQGKGGENAETPKQAVLQYSFLAESSGMDPERKFKRLKRGGKDQQVKKSSIGDEIKEMYH